MRWLAGLFLLLGLAAVAGYIFVKGYPYRLYSQWSAGKDWNIYYHIEGYRKLLLSPVPPETAGEYTEDYPQLWKSFPLRNSLVPLPTRHPMFLTIPLVEYRSKNLAPVIGIILSGPDKREISRVYTLPTRFGQDYVQQQELFKLPFVRNRILKMDAEQIWQDVFTRNIVIQSKSMEEMIRDLYILHIRSRIIPKAAVKYGLLQDGKAVIELNSKDKDYMMEIVLTQKNGTIYSYILRTAKTSMPSMRLRSKYLGSIGLIPVDPAMGRILYTEFKQLAFARQVDQEGLLYLFSAWTQDMEKTELLKDMIFYMERGRNNGPQLRGLYQFAFQKYGKTFTTRNLLSDSDDPELLVQRKAEIEGLEKKMIIERDMNRPVPLPELTQEEKMKQSLQKAKEDGPSESEDMTVH